METTDTIQTLVSFTSLIGSGKDRKKRVRILVDLLIRSVKIHEVLSDISILGLIMRQDCQMRKS